jgi:tetratricopeptide (TPR) repeat protein
MRSRRRLRSLALVFCLAAGLAPRVAHAEETSAANVAAARKHFEKARAYYGQGAYRDAVTELEAAHALDPNAKDLVFNLGVVHEKLSDIDEALKWFRLYTTMDLVPQERDRADAYVRRLEGAKKELEEKQAAQQQLSPEPTQPPVESPGRPPAQPAPGATLGRSPALPPSLQPPAAPVAGRVDGLTIGATSMSAAGLAFGVVMAVKAETDRPSDGYATGSTGTFSHLRSLQDAAHLEAILADIGFGVALVASASAAYLYFGRSRAAPAVSTGSTTVSAGPLSGGGAVVVKGFF